MFVAVLYAVGAPARQQSLQLQTPPSNPSTEAFARSSQLDPDTRSAVDQRDEAIAERDEEIAKRASGPAAEAVAAPEAVPDLPPKPSAEIATQERDAVIAQRDANILAGGGATEAEVAAPLPAFSSPNAPAVATPTEPTATDVIPAAATPTTPVAPITAATPAVPSAPAIPATGAQAQGSPSPVDWASGLPLPANPGALADQTTPAAPAAAVGANGEKIDWASGLPVPVPVTQNEDFSCLSIQAGIPDMWCSTRCAVGGDCPPDMCKCGEGARQQGEEARAQAARDWEDAENTRRRDAEQKKADPDKKFTDEPWKESEQAAQAMDNWKEAEARVKSAEAGTAYPDGLPPAPEETKEAEVKTFEPAEDIPMDRSCVSVGPWKSNANDYFCATSCAPGSAQPCSETICKCGDGASARRR